MTKVKAPKVIGALKAIQKRNGGRLYPEAVVAAARPAASPLHRYFEWDDGLAAEQYRLEQAADLIRIVVEVLPGTKVETRVFVSLTSDRATRGGYRLTLDVMNSAETRAQLLADARAELDQFRTKYRELSELAAVFEAIDRVK